MKVNKTDQIVTYIKWRINSGIYKPNKRIPSEAQLSRIFECARGTVRKAIEELKNEKFVVSRQAIGHFVSLSKNKLIVKPKNGDFSICKYQNINDLDLTENQKNGFKQLGIDWNEIKEIFKHKFIKSYFNEQNTPFTVIQSALNSKLFKVENETVLAESFSQYLTLNFIKPFKRIELAIMVKPDQHIKIKLYCKTNEFIPAIFSIMYTEDGQIMELAVQYYINEEFLMKKEIKY